MRRWPTNERRFRGRYFGVPALVAAWVHGIDTYYGRAMDWRSPGWRPGDSGGPDQSYRGYQPALQRFVGGLITPSSANVRAGLNQLLPGTTGLPGEPTGAESENPPGGDVQSKLPGAP